MTRQEFERVDQKHKSLLGFVMTVIELTFFRENPKSEDLAKMRKMLFDQAGVVSRQLEAEHVTE